MMDENLICPDELSPTTWVAAELGCMEDNADPKACSGEYKRVRDHWVYGATVLKCTEKGMKGC